MSSQVQKSSQNRKPSNAQFYQICNCLKENKDFIESKRMGQARAARFLEKQLGFEVSKHTVKRAVETVLGDEGPTLRTSKMEINENGPQVSMATVKTNYINSYRLRNAMKIVAEVVEQLDRTAAEEIREVIYRGRIPERLKRHAKENVFGGKYADSPSKEAGGAQDRDHSSIFDEDDD